MLCFTTYVEMDIFMNMGMRVYDTRNYASVNNGVSSICHRCLEEELQWSFLRFQDVLQLDRCI